MCEKAWRNVQPSTIVNCFKKAGFYFNDEQCDGDGLENNDNKQPKNQKLITNYFSTVSHK